MNTNWGNHLHLFRIVAPGRYQQDEAPRGYRCCCLLFTNEIISNSKRKVLKHFSTPKQKQLLFRYFKVPPVPAYAPWSDIWTWFPCHPWQSGVVYFLINWMNSDMKFHYATWEICWHVIVTCRSRIWTNKGLSNNYVILFWTLPLWIMKQPYFQVGGLTIKYIFPWWMCDITL